jgi:hypothetical protein
MEVYKPSKKAIKKDAFKESDSENLRLIFRKGDSSAILYRNGFLLEHSLYYRKPDSHVELIDEIPPKMLKVDRRVLSEINDYEIDMLGIELQII